MRIRMLALALLALIPGSCKSPDLASPPAPGVDQVLSAIGLLEYRASRSERGLQAPNRRHGIRTWFEPSGIRVVERVPSTSGADFALRLEGLGRGERIAPGGVGEVQTVGERVEIRRPGIVEWYENSAAGLEQGFDLAERPAGEGELLLELAVEGASVHAAGSALQLRTASGRSFGYGQLWARDAAGKELPSRLESPAPDRIRIRVADRAARYPLTIDPLLTSIADAVLSGSQDDASFGYSVAGAGDVNGDGYADVLVGAPLFDSGQSNEGAVFLYYGSAAGSAGSGGVSTLQSDQPDARLGDAVAGVGDVNGDGYSDIALAAFLYDRGENDEGAVFIFNGGPGGIPSASVSAASARLEGDIGALQFGFAVAGAGDVNGDGYSDVAVSTPYYESSLLQQDEGGAFVFMGGAGGIASAGTGSAAARIESNQANALLGFSVAGAGDVNSDGYADLIVGALVYHQGENDEGAGFVFLGSAAGIGPGNPGTAQAILQSDQIGARMGFSVAGLGDVNGDGFGDVAIGADLYDAAGTDSGEVYVFHGGAAGITSGNPGSAAARIRRIQGGERLGYAIAGVGDVDGDGYADLGVGSPVITSIASGISGGGAAVLFGSAGGIQTTLSGFSAIFANEFGGPHAGAQLGYAIGGAGDVNGDGYADLVVGIPSAIPSGTLPEGQAYVMHGSGGLGNARAGGSENAGSLIVSSTFQANQGGAEFGYSVRAAGDVNGDGYADAIIGAPFFDAGESNEGAAFVFYGNPSGLGDSPAGQPPAELQGNQIGAQFGFATASAGDVNGDGYGDVIVGAPAWDAASFDQGGAFIFLGSASGIADGGPSTAATRLEGTGNISVLFGDSVSSAGDVNGDGYGDVIVGEPAYPGPTSNAGQVYIFQGGPAGIADGNWTSASSVLQNFQQQAWFGISVAGAGDVNRDGFSDVIVGSYLYDSNEVDEGAAFVYHGSATGVATGFPEVANARLESDFANTEFGTSVAGAGDVNGDGYSDVIVGGWRGFISPFSVGIVGVFHGGPSGIGSRSFSAANSRLFPGDDDRDDLRFGISVAPAGDYDADGYSDVIVGGHQMAASPSTAAVRTGMASVLLGGPGGIPTGFVGNDNSTLRSPIWPQFALYGRDGQFDWLGVGLAGLGDVNGDGFSDVGVGAPLAEDGQNDEGLVYLALGGRGQAGRPALLRQVGTSGSPVALLGRSDASDRFGVRMLATHPEGRGLVRLEVETCPKRSAFGSSACSRHQSPSWVEASASGTELSVDPEGLFPDRPYRWRARVLHAPLSRLQPGISPPPAPGHGPWRRFLSQPLDGDIRTAISGSGPGTPATLYFQAVPTAATAICADPCFEVRTFLESPDPELEVRAVQFAVDVVGSATVPALPVPPALDTNVENALTLLGLPPDPSSPVAVPWNVVSIAGAADVAGFDARLVGASDTAYGVSEIYDLRSSASACTPGPRCATQLAGLLRSRIYLGRFNVTWNGGGVGARVGGIQGFGPMVEDPGVGVLRLEGTTFPIDGFPPLDDDPDGDGILGAADNCPYFASANTTDTDGDGRGDVCECTDQNGDGRNTVADLVAINLAIFNPALATPLCDGNNDGQCNVADIVAANLEIFSPTSTSICARYPLAGP